MILKNKKFHYTARYNKNSKIQFKDKREKYNSNYLLLIILIILFLLTYYIINYQI